MNMMTGYRFFFEIQFPDHTRKTVALEVSEEVATPFTPYDLADDALGEFLGGLNRRAAAMRDGDRKHIADKIAGELSRHIMEAIKSKDLRNGYEQSFPASKIG